ncbi:hypothetical protein H7Y63_04095 [Polaromonas sp.]|nr:hypothetical protein [Candidatus Saccharibacteria bacterium]
MTEVLKTHVLPIPSCEEGLLGIPHWQLITDIIVPELMDVDGRHVSLTYKRLDALPVSPNKSEYGYSQYNSESMPDTPRISQPARRGLMNRFGLTI